MRIRLVPLIAILLFVFSLFLFKAQNLEGAKNASPTAGKDAEQPAEETAPEEVEIPEPEPQVVKEKITEGEISGRLIDELGGPVGGVTVTAVDKNGHVVSETTTDEEGIYRFEGITEGEYTISVRYSGISAPLEIRFGDKKERAPIPTGLRVSEAYENIPGKSFIRATWNKMPDVLSYKAEVYKKGDREPVARYEDLLHTTFEFGNLEEDTDYQVRIFSKNEKGFSTSYALGNLHTANKPPFAPFGVGAVYAKNHRLDLIWSRVKSDIPKGYIISLRSGSAPWRYYSPSGLVADSADAFVVEDKEESKNGFSITGNGSDGRPLVQNGVPYGVRIYAVDDAGSLSPASTPVYGIVLEDTVPPFVPTNIKYEFVSGDRLRISWETKDTDISRYRVYYGLTPGRYDGIVYTDLSFYELIVDREKLQDKGLYVAVTAIDRAGNESVYRQVEERASVKGGETVSRDLVLSYSGVTKDLSPAIQQPPKKIEEKPKPKKTVPTVRKPTEYGLSYLASKGFVVEGKETATLSGKILLPEDTIIRVLSGGTLVVKGAELSAEKSIWGGIRFAGGSNGSVIDVTVRDALTGIAVTDNTAGVTLRGLTVEGCIEHGIYIKNSTIEMTSLTVRKNKTGIFIEDSDVRITGSQIEENEKGVLAYNYRSRIDTTRFIGNSVYGLRLYGGGDVTGCTFRNNYVGAAFDPGRGAARLLDSRVEKNRIDGVVASSSELLIQRTAVSGNGRNGVYVKNRENPVITESDITNNKRYGVTGGGRVSRCYVAYNNGSIYVDDTQKKGRPDDVTSSSSSGIVKQISGVDYIGDLTGSSVLQ
ncbi:MAG: right-handed parallel beta-helix repeat-containing protein [Spirochaetes bacterium]|nr:right-handed parallel beta-helix repeat-containing protein [Spirochaetota bacterium]